MRLTRQLRGSRRWLNLYPHDWHPRQHSGPLHRLRRGLAVPVRMEDVEGCLAYVSTTSAYVSIRRGCGRLPRIRQHYVSIRQHMSAYVENVDGCLALVPSYPLAS